VDVQRGVVRAYDSVDHQADVLVYGSMSRVILGVPVSDSIPGELMAVGANCGLVVFSPGDTGVVVCTFGATSVPPFGPRLGVLDMLLAWTDHFVGDTIHGQYATEISGTGSDAALMDEAHGGWLRLTSGPLHGRYANLFLGNTAYNYDTLDCDEGWVMACRTRVSSTSNIISTIGAVSAGSNEATVSIANSGAGAINWKIRVQKAGAATEVVSDVACDTDWHVHAVRATSGKFEYWLDEVKVATAETNVPIVPLTPRWNCFTWNVSASKYMEMDWAVIVPRLA